MTTHSCQNEPLLGVFQACVISTRIESIEQPKLGPMGCRPRGRAVGPACLAFALAAGHATMSV